MDNVVALELVAPTAHVTLDGSFPGYDIAGAFPGSRGRAVSPSRSRSEQCRAVSDTVTPRSFSEAAAALAGAAAAERPVRIVGGGTKLGWGGQRPPRALQLQTAHLSRVVVHDDGGTATLNAGTPLVRAQSTFARSGLMLAADPQLGLGRAPAATVGGVVATADSGPLSHRYGPLRDQIIGVTLALSDGTIVRTGPRTDHVQDGFDLARLFTGCVRDARRDPRRRRAAAAAAQADRDGARDRAQRRAARAAAAELVAQAHPELQALDVAWRDGRGGLLAQVAGDDADARAAAVAADDARGGLDDATVRTDDAGLWARQRAGQRSAERALLRVHTAPSSSTACSSGRCGRQRPSSGARRSGISYLTLDVTQIATVRGALPDDAAAVALDLPSTARGAVQPGTCRRARSSS